MIRPEQTTSGTGPAGLACPSDRRQPACPVLRAPAWNRMCALRQDPVFEEWWHLTAMLGIDLSAFRLLTDDREDAPLVAGVACPTDGADGDGTALPRAPDWPSLVRLELATSWQQAARCAPVPARTGR